MTRNRILKNVLTFAHKSSFLPSIMRCVPSLLAFCNFIDVDFARFQRSLDKMAPRPYRIRIHAQKTQKQSVRPPTDSDASYKMGCTMLAQNMYSQFEED